MKKLTFVLCTIIAFSAVLSCKKDDEPGVSELLTAKTWKATTLLRNGSPSTAWCTLSSTSQYANNGTGVYTEGDNLGACSGTAIGDTFHFNWTLMDDGTLYYPGNTPGYDDTVYIEELTATSLKLRYRIERSSGVVENWVEGFIPN